MRALTAEDGPQLRALATAAEREGFRFLTRFLREIESGARQFDAPAEFFLSLWHDDALVAVGGVTPDSYHLVPGTGRIRHVYVAASHRGQGHGGRLVTALERRARAVYSTLRLRTDTEVAAQFYERIGYCRVADPTATHTRALASDFAVGAT